MAHLTEITRRLWLKYIWFFRDTADDWEFDDYDEMPDTDEIEAAIDAAAQNLFVRLKQASTPWEGTVEFVDPDLNISRCALVRVTDLGGIVVGTVSNTASSAEPTEVILVTPAYSPVEVPGPELESVLTFLDPPSIMRVLGAVALRPHPQGPLPHLIMGVLSYGYSDGRLPIAYFVRRIVSEAILRFAADIRHH